LESYAGKWIEILRWNHSEGENAEGQSHILNPGSSFPSIEIPLTISSQHIYQLAGFFMRG
jgi:hypothetical protein